jgi:Luciferase-like monooxygenase.
MLLIMGSFDSVWVMDHLFIRGPGGRVLSHEPMICLAQVAAAPKEIKLGTLVLNHASFVTSGSWPGRPLRWRT